MNIDKSPMHFSNSPSELHVGREQSTSLKTSIMDQRSGNDMPLAREQGRVDFNVDNNTTASMSCSSGNETPLLDADNTDSVEDILMPSGMEKTVDFGQFFKEGYCNKPDIREPHQTIEVENNQEEGSSSNSNDKEKTEDDEWIGGVFEFSEEGNHRLNYKMSHFSFIVLFFGIMQFFFNCRLIAFCALNCTNCVLPS